jgi:S-adenosylmethionine:tRNA ribosyltransferase-isomerase
VVEQGDRIIEFDRLPDKQQQGQLAVPHYMGREERPQLDRERYQTVFAREEGSVAAPTAGLHFTPGVLAGLSHEFITLHVGPGTFQPVRVDNPDDHVMHTEPYEIPAAAAERIAAAKRVVAVGTTVTRVLEHVALTHGGIVAGSGSTNIFIRPGHSFRRVDALLTNFHLPQSTLLMLVSAFADRELMLEAYQHAITQRYRFYSYGDCMFIR